MNYLKRLFKRQTPDEKRRHLHKKKAIAVLKEKQLKFVENLGKGTFGDVIAVKGSKEIGEVAIKIIPAFLTWKGEITHWKEFDHSNVLPLLDYIPCDGFDLFLMPLHPKALNTMLKDKMFRSTFTAFDSVKYWMRGILSGLAYLHGNQICHLDLKANNVLITASNKAVLLDYSHINTTTKPVTRYGLIPKFLPPEAWQEMIENIRKVEGIFFDVWSFRLLMLNALTGNWYKTQQKLSRFWREDAYPHLFKALQPKFFESLVRQTFPRASVSETEIALALNLIQSCLRFTPKDRPQVSAILKHSWVSGNRMLEPDRIWKFWTTRGLDAAENDNYACLTEDSSSFSASVSQEFQDNDASREINKGYLIENLPLHSKEAVYYIEDISKVDTLLESEDVAGFSAFENNKYLLEGGTLDSCLIPELVTDPFLPSVENDRDSECDLQEVRELLEDVIASIEADPLANHAIEGGRVEEFNTADSATLTDGLSPSENFADFSIFETNPTHCGNVSPPIENQVTTEDPNNDAFPTVETALIESFDPSKQRKSLFTRVRGWFRKTFKRRRNN